MICQHRKLRDIIMKILIAADSFKGSLSSEEAGFCMAEGIQRVLPNAEIQILPLADGGEGTVQTIASYKNASLQSCIVPDLLGRETICEYALVDTQTAVIETAAPCGLTKIAHPSPESICQATSYGLGVLLMKAAQKAKRIYVGLGGSGCNDGGIGLAQALGWQFYDKSGELIPNGCACLLNGISRIDNSKVDSQLKALEIIGISDVNSPLLGEKGCAMVFGAQKGMDAPLQQRFDAAMADFARIVQQNIGINDINFPGAGAAGGLGFGLVCFAGGHLAPGIDTVLDIASFDTLLDQVDIVITGEGRLDGQSARGKVPSGVAKRAVKKNVPALVVAGSFGNDWQDIFDCGILDAQSAMLPGMDTKTAIQNARTLVPDAAERLMRAWLEKR